MGLEYELKIKILYDVVSVLSLIILIKLDH